MASFRALPPLLIRKGAAPPKMAKSPKMGFLGWLSLCRGKVESRKVAKVEKLPKLGAFLKVGKVAKVGKAGKVESCSKVAQKSKVGKVATFLQSRESRKVAR